MTFANKFFKELFFSSYIHVIYYEFFFNCGIQDISWTGKFWSIYEIQKTPVEENIF